jgi:hypothetical protein
MGRDFDIRQFCRGIIESCGRGDITPDAAVDQLLAEMARGGRILVVDENMLGLERELARLNYTVYPVDVHQADAMIMKELKGRVLITQNGQDFKDGCKRHYYGLIWVQGQPGFKQLAKKVEAALRRHNFAGDLTQVVKV